MGPTNHINAEWMLQLILGVFFCWLGAISGVGFEKILYPDKLTRLWTSMASLGNDPHMLDVHAFSISVSCQSQYATRRS